MQTQETSRETCRETCRETERDRHAATVMVWRLDRHYTRYVRSLDMLNAQS